MAGRIESISGKVKGKMMTRFKSPLMAAFTIALALSATTAGHAQSAAPTQSERDDVTMVKQDDPAMNAAIAQAQKTLPTFLAILDKPAPGTDMIGFKFPLGGWEYIWVDNVKRDGDFLTGTLANVPMQEKYQLGDAVKVPFKDVSDWAAFVDGKMQGHYITRIFLKQVTPEEAAAVKEQFGW